MVKRADPDPLSRTLAALADPTRRSILARLSRGPATVGELAEPFDLSGPAISKHLKVLERALLIERGRQAQWRPCTLRPEPLGAAAAWLETYRALWEARFGRLDALLAELATPKDPSEESR
jgi:DNA-binding transcriptional ArsR family regulator